MLPLRFTDRIPIGRKPLMVSPVCLGCVDSPELVVEAFKAGVNFFFVTTDMHWPVYEGLRQGLRELFQSGVRREDVVVAGASYVAQREFTVLPFKELADEVPGLQGVDIFVAGGCYEHDLAPTARIALYRQRALNPDDGSKVASAIATSSGASFHSRAAALEAINHEVADIAFTRYNAKNFGGRFDLHPHINPNTRTKVFNFLSCAGFVPKGFLPSIGEPDAWEPDLVDHYRLVLSEPNVDGILCAPDSLDTLMALRDILEKGPMEKEDIDHMLAIAQAYYHGEDLKEQGQEDGPQ